MEPKVKRENLLRKQYLSNQIRGKESYKNYSNFVNILLSCPMKWVSHWHLDNILNQIDRLKFSTTISLTVL